MHASRDCSQVPRVPEERRLPVLGLLGGVASGKSFVAGLLAQHGAAVLDADRAGHQVLTEQDIKEQLHARWGDRVFTPAGEVDRKAVGEIVFSDQGELEFLEAVTHPRIGCLLQEQIEHHFRQGAPAAVLDAPVMLKAGWDAMCDAIWFVDSPRPTRLKRALARGWTEAQFDAREAAQEPLDEKLRKSDVIIDNAGSSEATAALVARHWQQFLDQVAPHRASNPHPPARHPPAGG